MAESIYHGPGDRREIVTADYDEQCEHIQQPEDIADECAPCGEQCCHACFKMHKDYCR